MRYSTEDMCRVAPARVVRIEGTGVWLEAEGRTMRASLVDHTDVQVGDYVLCHAGLVLERLEPEEAEAILSVLDATDSIGEAPV